MQYVKYGIVVVFCFLLSKDEGYSKKRKEKLGKMRRASNSSSNSKAGNEDLGGGRPPQTTAMQLYGIHS